MYNRAFDYHYGRGGTQINISKAVDLYRQSLVRYQQKLTGSAGARKDILLGLHSIKEKYVITDLDKISYRRQFK